VAYTAAAAQAASIDDFTRIGWPTLVMLGVFAISWLLG
jgi:hypothetical protein